MHWRFPSRAASPLSTLQLPLCSAQAITLRGKALPQHRHVVRWRASFGAVGNAVAASAQSTMRHSLCQFQVLRDAQALA